MRKTLTAAVVALFIFALSTAASAQWVKTFRAPGPSASKVALSTPAMYKSWPKPIREYGRLIPHPGPTSYKNVRPGPTSY